MGRCGSGNDGLAGGAQAEGYKVLTFHSVGSDYPVDDDLREDVIDAGKAAGAGDQVGTVLYNRGIYAAMLVAEAARTAQEIHGVTDIPSGQMRDGLEPLEITEEQLAALGLPDFGPEFSVSCDNHGGEGFVAVTQWDAEAKEWNLVSDFMQSDQDVIQPLIDEDSSAYASENAIEGNC